MIIYSTNHHFDALENSIRTYTLNALAMGWSFRKSASFGPFRLNFSKSGISGSFGIKGARISTGKRGTYVTFGSNGVYYRQRISGNKHPSNSPIAPVVPEPALSNNTIHTITSSDLENLTDVNSQAFVEELESKSRKKNLFGILGLYPSLILMVYFLNASMKDIQTEDHYKDVFTVSKRSVFVRDLPAKTGNVLYKALAGETFDVTLADTLGWVQIALKEGNGTYGFIRADLGGITKKQLSRGYTARIMEPDDRLLNSLLFILFTCWCIYLYRNDRKRKTLEIYYAIDKEVETLHLKFLEFFREFASSKRVWQKLHEQGVDDKKYHAGATSLVSRVPVKGIHYHKLPSPFLKTNVTVPCISLRNTELYFFPERIILKRGDGFGAVVYQNIQVSNSNVKFIEEEALPSDATVVDYTWKYPNSRGGPDKRFSYNPQLPICLYTDYSFESETGIHEVITTSKVGGMDNFAAFIKLIGEYQMKLN